MGYSNSCHHLTQHDVIYPILFLATVSQGDARKISWHPTWTARCKIIYISILPRIYSPLYLLSPSCLFFRKCRFLRNLFTSSFAFLCHHCRLPIQEFDFEELKRNFTVGLISLRDPASHHTTELHPLRTNHGILPLPSIIELVGKKREIMLLLSAPKLHAGTFFIPYFSSSDHPTQTCISGYMNHKCISFHQRSDEDETRN